MICTYNHQTWSAMEPCSEQATHMLQWTEQVTEGWEVRTTRAYCERHANETYARFVEFRHVVKTGVIA